MFLKFQPQPKLKEFISKRCRTFERHVVRPLILTAALSSSLSLSGCLVLAVGAAGGAAGGAVTSTKHDGYAPMVYVGTVFANALYVPAKVVFAGGGAVVSGVSYLVTGGNGRVSREIWDTSVGGNYLLTPAMINGEQPIEFAGQTDR